MEAKLYLVAPEVPIFAIRAVLRPSGQDVVFVGGDPSDVLLDGDTVAAAVLQDAASHGPGHEMAPPNAASTFASACSAIKHNDFTAFAMIFADHPEGGEGRAFLVNETFLLHALASVPRGEALRMLARRRRTVESRRRALYGSVPAGAVDAFRDAASGILATWRKDLPKEAPPPSFRSGADSLVGGGVRAQLPASDTNAEGVRRLRTLVARSKSIEAAGETASPEMWEDFFVEYEAVMVAYGVAPSQARRVLQHPFPDDVDFDDLSLRLQRASHNALIEVAPNQAAWRAAAVQHRPSSAEPQLSETARQKGSAEEVPAAGGGDGATAPPLDPSSSINAILQAALSPVVDAIGPKTMGVVWHTEPSSRSPAPASADPTSSSDIGDEHWSEGFADKAVRRVFLHLQQYGAVSESEATSMLGSPRAYRHFCMRFDEHALRLPFKVRVDAGAHGKVYVREGEK